MKKLILITLLFISSFCKGQINGNPQKLIINTWICSDARYDTTNRVQYNKVKSVFKGEKIDMNNAQLLADTKNMNVLAFKENGILIESDKFEKNTKKNYIISPNGSKFLSYRSDGNYSKMDTTLVLKLTADTLITHSGIVRLTYTSFK